MMLSLNVPEQSFKNEKFELSERVLVTDSGERIGSEAITFYGNLGICPSRAT